MINLARVIKSPAFRQRSNFSVTRTTVTWVDHREVTNKTTFSVSGIITPNKTKDMRQTAEGDKITGDINVYTEVPLLTSRHGNQNGLPDEIEWRGEKYKVIQTEDWRDFGFYKSLAVRVKGA